MNESLCKIKLHMDKEGISISPFLYGIFFEDINYGGDGGMYAELISNRSFENFDYKGESDKHLMSWEKVQSADSEVFLRVCSENPQNSVNPHYLNITAKKPGTEMGVKNLGYHNAGFFIKAGNNYVLSLYARSPRAGILRAELKSALSDKSCGEVSFEITDSGWKKYKTVIQADHTSADATLVLTFEGMDSLDLDFVSLFPENTFNKRENGLRADLVQLLKDLKLGFMRFPGGCIVEGRTVDNMYRWKETIGPVEERRTNWNRWQMEEYQIKGRSSEDYFQTYGLGFYEYFLLCEDLGATPLPILNVGMTCQWHKTFHIPLDSLDPWIQDILDLIEFANGDENTVWGRKRIELGHAEPFHLQYIGVGNEQWGKDYFDRYEIFHRAIKEKYPEVQLITSAGWTSEGEDFDYAMNWMKNSGIKADLVDEHFYKKPQWFLQNINRYDNYDRSLPKVFAGEYACHTTGETSERRNNWEAAMVEAAFLTGVEKNSDHVFMTCYAPLFGKIGYNTWQPNLIWFDNEKAFGTPSYYVQQLFSHNTGTRIIETSVEDAPMEAFDYDAEWCMPRQLHIVASLDEGEKEIIIKAVNLSCEAQKARIFIDAGQVVADTASEIILCSYDLKAENSLEEPLNISPVIRRIDGISREFDYEFKGFSVTVLRIGYNR